MITKLELRESHRKRSAAFRTCFQGLYGGEVLGYLSKICRAFESTFVPGDPYATAYNEGKRAVYLYIYDQIKFTPDELAENYDRYLRLEEYELGRPV